ncbi:probable arginine--tRNA ligase, cytoplasmic isoform X1 [Schistocerca gregaria]|nr:probable arginine--tRNA ligase, cytoplasmic isoform X1 [Schistocerca gregaria]XP_049851710.1 probable arginine--tRNA ligase, cytoplasmic isoform X1 [Schistocerca gregaria]
MDNLKASKCVLSDFRDHLAAILSNVSGFSMSQCSGLIEDRYDGQHEFSVALQKLRMLKLQGDVLEIGKQWLENFVFDDWITGCDLEIIGEGKKERSYLFFSCNRLLLAELALKRVFLEKENYGASSLFEGQKVLVEFSSPNIAKPFHAGHLRSTIIGNFINNIYKKMGANTITMNYLGDWGMQFGLLALGYERFGSEEELSRNPIYHLFDIYVKANKVCEEDSTFRDSAREYFKAMEEGDEGKLASWRRFRELSIREYEKTYDRLNVKFDVYSGESQVCDGIPEVLDLLKEKNLIEESSNGGLFVNLKKYKLNVAMVQKSDGATLYITRDISAAKKRYDTYKFDKCIYVSASQQDYYMQQLFKILELMEFPWASKCIHINYGLVLGMSTRKGTAVFLDQILNESRDIMLEKILENKMGKLEEIEDPKKTADIIGLSTVIVQDLSAHRARDYSFDWKRMTRSEGSTGVYLQYTHARLCSLEDKTSDITLTDQIDYKLLIDNTSFQLILQIARYPSVLLNSVNSHEPSILLTYLFTLAHWISTAHTSLKVLRVEPELAKARKTLFWSARTVLHDGLKLIGVTPLIRM